MHQKACKFCQKRKVRCNRRKPCNSCSHFGKVCVFSDHDAKRRPVDRGYVEALEGQIASLENFISQLVAADTKNRIEMLSAFRDGTTASSTYPPPTNTAENYNSTESKTSTRSLNLSDGKRCYATSSFPGIFHGATVSETQIPLWQAETGDSDQKNDTFLHTLGEVSDSFAPMFDPHGPYCRNSMVLFFNEMYTSNMCLYREYFLRDYHAGGGPYYSELLMYAVCAMGGLVGDSHQQQLSEVFAHRCEELFFGSEVERTRFTTLQALLLMGSRAIGRGQNSKGWLFTGVAFRMIHEMGLHQDPMHWKLGTGSELQREIFRRVYWAAFVIDKQMSLYFGRPPALQPKEADVKVTIRIPYPPEWTGLLQRYLRHDMTPESYEHGVELVEAFVQRVELCQIIHQMWTRVFARRNSSLEPCVLDASVREIHTSLVRWQDNLPLSVRWNRSTKDKVPPYIIQLHMLYHTAIMVLCKPQAPRDLHELSERDRNSLKICHQSVEAVIHLIKATKKEYKQLSVDFIHTAATTASVILAGRHIATNDQERIDYNDQLDQLIKALNGVVPIWSSAQVVCDAISTSSSQQALEHTVVDSSDSDLRENSIDLDQWLNFDGSDDLLGFDLMNYDSSFDLEHGLLQNQSSEWEQQIHVME